MPLVSQANQRIVDHVLTGLAHDYEQQDFVGLELAPAVPVGEHGGNIIQFDDSHFEAADFTRAPGAEFRTIQSGYEGRPFKLKYKGGDYSVPMETSQDTMRLGIDWDLHATTLLMERLLHEHERETASVFTTTGNYATTHRAALSGADQWNSGTADITTQIRDAIGTVGRESGSERNLVLWMGRDVFHALRQDASIRGNFGLIGDSASTANRLLTAPMLASYFEVEKVVVGTAVTKDQTGAKNYIWGNFAGVCKVHPSALTAGNPRSVVPQNSVNRHEAAFAYTYTLQAGGKVDGNTGRVTGGRPHPQIQEPWYDKRTESMIYRVVYDRSVELVGMDFGYLFSNVLA